MAASRIKGITIEIGGDTTKLQTALKGVNTEIRNTQQQLKDVEKLLKLDPGNTELLAQKQKLLKDAVQETKEKLETLKTAAEQANTALANGDISQSQYDALQREIIETEKELERLEQQANQSATALQKIAADGEKLKTMGDNVSAVGQKFLPVTAGVTALGTAAVKTAADFDSAMSKVAAVSGATGEEFDKLKAKAREMGSKTKFSASEAAEAMNYMAMAGWKTEDMLGGIEGVMNLAAASGEDLATTSDIVTDALTAFGLSASESGHFADVLAAASSNANTNVSMMGETFKYCAPIAGSLGFSVEDTAEAIGLMANAGIKSTQAGTALRTIMTNLSGDVKICGESIGEVSIATTNADGSMRDLSDILADCRMAFSGLSESEKAAAAESLVGKNAMSGFLALMNAGEADINKLSGAIANCDGTAAGMADTMQDNLAGQLTILKSQLEELAISFGELLMPAIRQIVSWIQGFVDKLNSMDEGTRKFIVTIALVAAAIGPVLIIVGKVMSAIGTIMTIIPKLAGVINAAKGVIAAFNAVCAANPYVLIIAAIVALVAAFIYLWNNCEEFRQFWIDLWEGIKEIAIAVWEALKEFFVAAWEFIKTTAETVWNGIKNLFSSLWEGIKNIFQTVVDAIKLIITTYFNIYKTIITTVLTAIQTVFTTIWNAIKTVVTTVVTAISTFLTTAWTAIQTTAITIWNAISSFFTNIWNAIKTAITTAVNAIKNTVTTAWNNIKNKVVSVGNAIKSAVTTVWNNVTSAVKNAMSNVFNAVKNGFSNVKNHITGLASQAFNWGKDLIMGIVNGIKSCIGAVGDAVSSVAEKIKSFLHFSVPDEGPLTDYESWMPDFMKGLANGIDKSKKLVADAVDGVAADMIINPKVAAPEMAMAGGSSVSSSDLSSLMGAIKDAVSGMVSGQTGDIVIPVYLGGTMLDEVIVNAQQRMNLRSGGR
ncbi:phage tail tape measure protein [Butyrivibrio sp. M55]|uniref:phage tail tape measure protein n=1 Tax=Butyrivibrio sp. M55 TaxID=1855323 RepID=UPI0008F1EB96|nr:phage tail tape measure protein [Butyrivibrio sp. M55]SFU89075.1 phage tail tape measure protein, TP901 family, core region [Butyrivibrio sp. M55]